MSIRAFTILELLIVIILLGILYTFGFQTYAMFNRGVVKKNGRTEMMEEIMALEHALSQDLKKEGLIRVQKSENSIFLMNKLGLEVLRYHFGRDKVIRTCQHGEEMTFFVVGGIESFESLEIDRFHVIPNKITFWVMARDIVRFKVNKLYSAEELYWGKMYDGTYADE